MNDTRKLVVLMGREWRRFLRQPSRVVSAILTGGLFWLFLASGLSGPAGSRLAAAAGAPEANASYAAYLVPGIALMIVMFATVFASIGLIQDRASGFLRAALASPAPMWTIAGSKLLAAALIAGCQGVIVLAGVWAIGPRPGVIAFLAAAAVLMVAAGAVAAVGLGLAWRIGSVSGFHGVMNVVLLPAWALSGALFPPENAAGWMAALMRCNPAMWAHSSVAGLLGLAEPAPAWHTPALAVFAAVAFLAAAASMRRSDAR